MIPQAGALSLSLRLRHASDMRWCVIVNGPPASGKTTLSRQLAPQMGLPLLSKDAVKETLLNELGFSDRANSRRIGAAAGEVLWTILKQSVEPMMLESWLAPNLRELVDERLRRAGVDRAVEIWCECPVDTARRRYAARVRHAGHYDAEFLPILADVYATASPLALGPVLRVDTSGSVSIDALAAAVSASLRSA